MEAEKNHGNDLQGLEVVNKRLQEQHKAEMVAIQLNHANDMKIFETSNRVLKDKLRDLKSALTRLNEHLDINVKTEEDLRKELQATVATNMKLQEQHHAEIGAMLQNHAMDRKMFETKNRVLKSALIRLNEHLDRNVKTEEDLRKELQATVATNKKLQEQHKAEMESMQLNYANDMKILETSNRVLKDKLRDLKSALTRLNEHLDINVKTEEDLRKELQATVATNKKLQEQHHAEIEAMRLNRANDMKILETSNRDLIEYFNIKVKTEQDLRKELQATVATNIKLQEQHKAEMLVMLQIHANDMMIFETNNRELKDKLRVLESANVCTSSLTQW
jgi:hypothetical protein